jgi:hypothetical protein
VLTQIWRFVTGREAPDDSDQPPYDPPQRTLNGAVVSICTFSADPWSAMWADFVKYQLDEETEVLFEAARRTW